MRTEHALAALAYILIGRAIVTRASGGRQIAFTLLNLAALYYFFFYGKDARFVLLFSALFVVYVAMVSGNYLVLRVWGAASPWLAFASPIAMLIVIRYLPIRPIAALLGTHVQAVLERHPEFTASGVFVGVSYLAFRTSYLVLEVRNGVVAQPGYWQYVGFALFLPTLSVGPLQPYSQYHAGLSGTPPAIPIGRSLLRVLLGGVKFRFLGPLLNQLTYAGLLLDGHPHPWLDLPVAALAYYGYLYCNFSGFCDMAVGGAGLMRIAVPENFDNPFSSRNVREFWNRWHITLSVYMRDVVFSPLSKALVRRVRPTHANHAIAATIVVVFLLVGIWHGAGWNYAAFGAAHATGVVANHYYSAALKKRLGRKRFEAYNQHRGIRALAVTVTFTYVTACFFLFANSTAEMHTIWEVLGTP